MNPHAIAFLTALAGIDTVYDFRAIHDQRADVRAEVFRGTLSQVNEALTAWNNSGYGIHVMINATDGQGRKAINVNTVRGQICDLDGPNSPQNYQRLLQWQPAPHAIVNTSPGKAQFHWFVQPHNDHALYVEQQRKLIAAFEGDKQFIDPAHTCRLPGFYHLKRAPHFVTVAAGPGWGSPRHAPAAISQALAHVTVIANTGGRHPLGKPSLAAPSLEWIAYALSKLDPNELSRLEWIAITAAVKQAGYVFGVENTFNIWAQWCAQYKSNNPGENWKQWNSITETEAGWPMLSKRSGIEPELMFQRMQMQQPVTQSVNPGEAIAQTQDTVSTEETYLTPQEQAAYFKGCVWITSASGILTPSGRILNQTQFNAIYGGKVFVISAQGKITDEPFKAATRGQIYTVPKVDHMRFLPLEEPGAIIRDQFGQLGVNTYRIPKIESEPGDITPFIEHMKRLLPIERDRALLLSWLAHNVQFPGFKIMWAPLIQSIEGAGKRLFYFLMSHALGMRYVYSPKANQLMEGGGKFNAWMSNRLMIIVDEIKTDEKRELVEMLKPFITDNPIEMEGKGTNQGMEDNPANWLFFTNWQDAIPISVTSRRYGIFYSPLQTMQDLQRAGMDGQYFKRLYHWLLKEGGNKYVTDFLKRYQFHPDFEAEGRAPNTSSTESAIELSRSPIENMIKEAMESGRAGFRNGWVSSNCVAILLKENGYKQLSPVSMGNVLKNLGLSKIGRASRCYFQENPNIQGYLYNLNPEADKNSYASDQGYELNR